MNRAIQRFLVLAAIILVAACKKEEGPVVAPVSVDFEIAFDESLSGVGFSSANTQVKMTNVTNSQEVMATAGADGIVRFESLLPGTYNITATLTISKEVYEQQTGTSVEDDVVFNASLTSQTINAQSGAITLVMKTGRLGDWVFKQVYYAGSSASNGAVFRDQFIELYNNSNEVLYADSLYFSQVKAVSTESSKIDLSKPYFQSAGQYDWSFTVSTARANEDYVYVSHIFMIPSDGTGKKYPVQPGESIVIAKKAINHKEPYIGTDNKPITVKDPSLTIDLSNAEFDTYLGDYAAQNGLGEVNKYDINVLGKTKLEVLFSDDRYLNFDNNGRDAFIIFKTGDNVKQWPRFKAPDTAPEATDPTLFPQVPISAVIDAIELQTVLTTKRTPKRLQTELDASPVNVPGGAYSSQSLVRKTGKQVNGRRILKDTNNSAEDFGYLPMADPSKQASSFID